MKKQSFFYSQSLKQRNKTLMTPTKKWRVNKKCNFSEPSLFTFPSSLLKVPNALRQIAPCKVIHESLGLRIPGTRIKIPPQQILNPRCWVQDSIQWTPDPTYSIQYPISVDSRSQVLESRFHLSGFQIPGTGFRIPPQWIPESGYWIQEPQWTADPRY